MFNLDKTEGYDVRTSRAMIALQRFAPEVVYHLAALHFIPYCNAHPQNTLDVNVHGTDRLLRTLSCTPSVRSVVFASSAAVYGFGADRFDEDAEPAPVDVYGQSKWLGEKLLRRFADENERVDTVVAARLFNVVGRGDAHRHVLPRIANDLREYGTVTLGNRDSLRDYVHADDAASALIRLSENVSRFSVFNIGTGVGTSVGDLAEWAVQVRGSGAVEWKEGRVVDGHLISNSAKLYALGWQPILTVRDVVRDLVS